MNIDCGQIIRQNETKSIDITLHNIDTSDISDISISFVDKTPHTTQTVRNDENGNYVHTTTVGVSNLEAVRIVDDEQIPGQMSLFDNDGDD